MSADDTDLDRLEKLVRRAMSEAWDEGYRKGKSAAEADPAFFTRPVNPYRLEGEVAP